MWLLRAYLMWEGFWLAHALLERRILYGRALAAARARDKPLLVVGSPHGMYNCGDVLLDLKDTGECESFTEGSVENMPFEDDRFGAVFVSHVLEHVCDPRRALTELHRVADEVFVAWPRPWRTIAWASPGHAWLMSKRGEAFEFKRLRDACNAPGFFGTGP
jgi:SAM-dependent methyltransferase